MVYVLPTPLKHLQCWGSNGFVSFDRLPKEYGIARKAIYVNKDSIELEVGEKNPDRKVSKERFLYLGRHLHDVLWGGGGIFYNSIAHLVKLYAEAEFSYIRKLLS